MTLIHQGEGGITSCLKCKMIYDGATESIEYLNVKISPRSSLCVAV